MEIVAMYLSTSKDAEMKYPVIEKELLSIKKAVKTIRHYIHLS
jgi:RNase H-like domain found in reverse transcriptase